LTSVPSKSKTTARRRAGNPSALNSGLLTNN
jgi:hypothetical protein